MVSAVSNKSPPVQFSLVEHFTRRSWPGFGYWEYTFFQNETTSCSGIQAGVNSRASIRWMYEKWHRPDINDGSNKYIYIYRHALSRRASVQTRFSIDSAERSSTIYEVTATSIEIMCRHDIYVPVLKGAVKRHCKYRTPRVLL